MRMAIAAFVALACAGCLPPTPTAPAPMQLHVAATPSAVVQSAAHTLTLAGFDVAVADASGGVLNAKLVRSPAELDSLVACRFRKGSMAAGMSRATLAVSVSAAPTASGSDIVVHSAVTVSYAQMPAALRVPDSDTDCASSGAIERSIIRALPAPATTARGQ